MVPLLLLFMEMKPLHPAFLKGLWEYGICDTEWASWSPTHSSTNINLTISLQHHVFHTSSIISQYRIWSKLLSWAKYFPQDLLMLVPSTLECLLRYLQTLMLGIVESEWFVFQFPVRQVACDSVVGVGNGILTSYHR